MPYWPSSFYLHLYQLVLKFYNLHCLQAATRNDPSDVSIQSPKVLCIHVMSSAYKITSQFPPGIYFRYRCWCCKRTGYNAARPENNVVTRQGDCQWYYSSGIIKPNHLYLSLSALAKPSLSE